jgi:hypothetical protein
MLTNPLKRSILLNVFLVCAAFYAFSIRSARADTIASVGGASINGDPLVDNGAVLEVNWTTSAAYDNVTIDATLGIMPGPDPNITAYLTTQIGPLATPASEVTAPVTVSVSGSMATYTLFSLPALAADTYYLVLTGDPGAGLLWYFADSPTFTTAPGASIGTPGQADDGNSDAVYPPASTFATETDALLFDVNGAPLTAVPEASSLGMLALLGLAGICAERLVRRFV